MLQLISNVIEVKMSNFFNKLFGKKKDEQQPIDVDTSTAKSSLKLGLALSGGGTRGLAYLGAFRALEENGVHFDYVSGTSVGSLMGAVYASKISLDELEQKAKSVTSKDILTNHFKFMPSGTQKFSTFIKSVLDGKGFGDFEIPLTIVATDIISGNEIWINQGDIGDAIAGSCAVPFIFKPVEFNGYRLYDGGLVNKIPADVVRDMGADIVIAFDINPERGFGTDSTKTWEELKAALRILMKSNSVNGYVYSDAVVKIDLSNYDRTKLDDVDGLIREGYEQTIKQMPEILRAIRKSKPDEDIKKTERRLKNMIKTRKKFERRQQKLIDKGVIVDVNQKRNNARVVIQTGEDE